MPIQITVNGARVVVPGVYSITKIAPATSFLVAPGGIVGLIGEADAGAPTSSEDIHDNSFTQDQYGQLLLKYRSGPLVDAALLAFNPSNSNIIPNGANLIYTYKTNASTQASRALTMGTAITYGNVDSSNYGNNENTISEQIKDSISEAAWTYTFDYIPHNTAATVKARVNGGAAQSRTIAALALPSTFVTNWNALSGGISGIQASGGTESSTPIATGKFVSLDFDSSNIATFSYWDDNLATTALDWVNAPSVGDILFINTTGGNPLKGGSNENVGGYKIIEVTSNTIKAWKLADPTTSADITTTPLTALGGTTDIRIFGPVTLTYGFTAARTALGTGATVTKPDSDTMRVTFTGGGAFGDAFVAGNYVTISGSLFNSANRGTFKVTAINTGSVYFDVYNPSGVAETIASAVSNDDVTLVRSTLDGTGAAIEIFDGAGTSDISEIFFGGNDRGVLNTGRTIDGSTLALDASAGDGTVIITISSAFVSIPEAGDTVLIPNGSILKGTANANVGNYVVTSADAQNIYAFKPVGTPVTVTATDIAATTDLMVYEGFTSTDLVPVVKSSTDERAIQVVLNRASDNTTEESDVIGGNVAMEIGYNGTTATLTINSANLLTTVSGGSGSSLTLKLSDYNTIQALADYINSQTDYSAYCPNATYGALSPTLLDRVTSVGICGEFAGSRPGRVKIDSYQLNQFFSISEIATLTRATSGYAGLPFAQSTPQFLSGGSKGGTTQGSVSDGFDAFESISLNTVVPLFSRNAVDDIQDELTEPSSSYQIEAVNLALRAHLLKMSNTKNREERNGYASIKSSFKNSRQMAQTINNARVSLTMQDVRVLLPDGDVDWRQPWAFAAIAAGMQGGAPVGEPMTNKLVQVNGIRHQDYDYQKDKDQALLNGLLVLDKPNTGGFRVVLGNTTYLSDDNFVYNRISTMYASDTLTRDLRTRLEQLFIGRSLAAIDGTSIYNTVVALMGSYLAAGLIVGDDTNGGRGFKNLTVKVNGNIAYVDITVTIVQGLDFIVPTISLDTIRQTVA